MKVFLLFLDGVGIGKADKASNPFFAANLPVLRSICGGSLPHGSGWSTRSHNATSFAVDATLGVEGLPQSGTGQTAILTGENAARTFGRHHGPFIPTLLRPLVKEKGLFTRVVRSGKRAALANAFPSRFFEYTNGATRRLSAMTFASLGADLPLRTVEDLRRNEAVSADVVRERWNVLGHPEIGPISPEEAGSHAATMVNSNDLTVFDYWLTDHAGHAQDAEMSIRVLERLDAFLGSCIGKLDPDHTLVLAVSDHGNIEDLSIKTHTRNDVLGFAIGGKAGAAAERIHSLTDVAPFIQECLAIRS